MLSPDVFIPRLALVAFLLLVGFPFHEFAHAFVSYRLGDATAKMFGRLTLDPRAHFDRVGGTMLIVSGLLLGLPFGFAATPINPANLRNRRNAEVYVAMAGPAANLLLAIVGAIVYRVVVGHAPVHGDLVSIIVYLFVTWNVLLALLNCLPVPPLDGAALLWRVLSPRQVWQLRPILNQYGILIVVAVFFGLSSYISPLLYGVTDALVGV